MRWSVAHGGYPDGWDYPFLETDDAEEAALACEAAIDKGLPSMTTVAIFDDHGEGEPLGPECVRTMDTNTRSGLRSV